MQQLAFTLRALPVMSAPPAAVDEARDNMLKQRAACNRAHEAGDNMLKQRAACNRAHTLPVTSAPPAGFRRWRQQ